MKDIIVATWGIGEAYRNRIKHNIRKAISTGYENILPYIILTDKPSEFQDLLNETDLILKILDINEEREKYSPWSKELEHIPPDNEDKEYGKKYREENYKNGKIFSYALNRFSLPTISEMGYKKFILCDSDTDIRYDRIVNSECTEKEFWNEYNTPINTMKGCDLEVFHMNRECDGGYWIRANVVMANLLRFYLQKKYTHLNKPHYLSQEYTQTEGPFRYYKLDSPQKVRDVFNLWDDSMKYLLSEKVTREQLCPGRYMYIDNVPFSITNELLGIKNLDFGKFWHTVNIYLADRYFFPKGHGHNVNGRSLSLQPADTKEEFYKINEELINYFKSRGQWID